MSAYRICLLQDSLPRDLRKICPLENNCSAEVLESNLIPLLQVYGLRLHAFDFRFFHMLGQLAMELRQIFFGK